MTEAGRRAFTISSKIDNDPFPPSECDLYTATIWTLHVRCEPGSEPTILEKFMRTGAEILTGEYVGGDSFAEWCEVYTHETWYREHGTALHLYYTAPDLESAISRGRALCLSVGIDSPYNATISSAGDWAEQAEVFPREEARSG